MGRGWTCSCHLGREVLLASGDSRRHWRDTTARGNWTRAGRQVPCPRPGQRPAPAIHRAGGDSCPFGAGSDPPPRLYLASGRRRGSGVAQGYGPGRGHGPVSAACSRHRFPWTSQAFRTLPSHAATTRATGEGPSPAPSDRYPTAPVYGQRAEPGHRDNLPLALRKSRLQSAIRPVARPCQVPGARDLPTLPVYSLSLVWTLPGLPRRCLYYSQRVDSACKGRSL